MSTVLFNQTVPKKSNGLIEQWGYCSGQSNISDYTITFNVVFNSSTSFIPTAVVERISATNENVTISSRTPNSMAIHTQNTYRSSFWSVQGY